MFLPHLDLERGERVTDLDLDLDNDLDLDLDLDPDFDLDLERDFDLEDAALDFEEALDLLLAADPASESESSLIGFLVVLACSSRLALASSTSLSSSSLE